MSRIGPFTASIALALVLAGPAAAQDRGAALDFPIESYELDNGLHVILSRDPSTPVVAVDVWYNVGSRNERPGRSGFAHLFEHMMFEGSAHVAKGEHMQLIERAGGSMNGSTTQDRTNYFETLPANRLNLGLWLEADRMASLAITPVNLENQRAVVKEERRRSYDNSPYGTSFLAAYFSAPYSESCFAYHHSVIGSMDDLDDAKLQDVKDFFATYYAPDNATLTVVGDFDTAATKALIQQYFGSIPAQAAPPPVTCDSPFSELPVTDTIADANANLPAVFLSYGAPDPSNPDVYALDLLGSILGQGESSRLNQRLVKDESAALETSAGLDLRRGPGLFIAYAIANQGVTPDRLESLLSEEIARIRDEGVTAEELDKAKNANRASSIRRLQTTLGRAEQLQFYSHYFGDPTAIRTDLERYDAVTRADIQRVANEYLVPDNRATVITEPVQADGEGEG